RRDERDEGRGVRGERDGAEERGGQGAGRDEDRSAMGGVDAEEREGADEGAAARRRHAQADGRGVATDGRLAVDPDENAEERKGEGGGQAGEADDRAHGGVAADVAQPLADAAGAPASVGAGRGLDDREAVEHGEEAEAVRQEGEGGRGQAEDRGRERRPDE